MHRIAVLLCLQLALLAGDARDRVRVSLVVRVPADTPGDARLVIVGSSAELGRWRPEMGVALDRQADGSYRAQVDLERGARVEYKVCQQDWAGVEKSADGRDIENRALDGGDGAMLEVKIEVARWPKAADIAAARERRRAPREPTIAGTVRLHRDFPSRYLEAPRHVQVYLPPGYDEDPSRRFPVLYLHDGQNVFDRATASFGVEWEADETAERLIRGGRIEPLIIVGVHNTSRRIEEYTPPAGDGEEAAGRKSAGDRYARFLVEELKPFIDREYRTLAAREHTGIGGSSLGGSISLWIAARHPEVFSRCAALSPALWWREGRVLRELEADGGQWLRRVKIWVDAGTEEGRVEPPAAEAGALCATVRDARALVGVFDRGGLVPGRDYYYWEEAGTRHDEAAWARRFDKALLFLWGK